MHPSKVITVLPLHMDFVVFWGQILPWARASLKEDY